MFKFIRYIFLNEKNINRIRLLKTAQVHSFPQYFRFIMKLFGKYELVFGVNKKKTPTCVECAKEYEQYFPHNILIYL